MTKEFLEKCLAHGLSLEQIGERVGRHPSTVSYHLKKHGLRPVGHHRHAPNGRVDPARLRALVASGATIRHTAVALGVSYTTVRHWLKRLDVETERMVRLRESRVAIEQGNERPLLECARHGRVEFFKRPDGNFRCSRCRSEDVSEWRRRVKRRLVQQAGGCCQLCGYGKHPGALHFHHLDPKEKLFSLSREGVTRSFAEAELEAAKCILLCGNCHAEVEAGLVELAVSLAAGGKVKRSEPLS